jgi:hypothetical protein
MAYAVAGLATAAATVPDAEAEIHYFSPVQIHLKGRVFETWQLPLTAGARLTFYRFALSAPTAGTYFTDLVQVSRNAAVHAIRDFTNFYAANLPAGSNVSGGAFISTFGGLIGPRGQFVSAGVGFVGFKFDVGNGVQYGWVQMRTAKGGTRFDPHVTVLDYAFADPGEPILAGQKSTSDLAAPDQGSLGLLALGAVGLTAWRKSRVGKVSPGAP